MSDRPLIAVTASDAGDDLRPFLDAVERAGAEPWPITAGYALTADEILARAGALVLSDGPDVNPARYGQSPGPEAEYDDARDRMEIALVRAALDVDLPVYGVGRGMHVLNVALGGALLQDVDGHFPTPK